MTEDVWIESIEIGIDKGANTYEAINVALKALGIYCHAREVCFRFNGEKWVIKRDELFELIRKMNGKS